MTCRCYDGHLERGYSNILLIGEGRNYVNDHYIDVNCVVCGRYEEIYNREMRDIYTKKISIEGMKMNSAIFVKEYQYVKELLGLSQIEDENIYEMMVAIVDAYRTNYYLYWEGYSFQYVRKAIVTVLLSNKYDDCSKKFLSAMKKELKNIANESFCLEVLLENLQSQDFDSESQKKYGPAGVKQTGCFEGQSYSEKYLEKKNYQRLKKEIKGEIFSLQKGILQKLVLILRQNYKCRSFAELKVDRKISLASIKNFVNEKHRDSIFLKGYSIIFESILDSEFLTEKDINERNYNDKIKKLKKVDEFVTKYLK